MSSRATAPLAEAGRADPLFNGRRPSGGARRPRARPDGARPGPHSGAALSPLGVDDVASVTGDVTDLDSVDEALTGCRAVIHCASVYSIDPRAARTIGSTNVAGTNLVLGRARLLGLDPIVHVSSPTRPCSSRGRALASLAGGCPRPRPVTSRITSSRPRSHGSRGGDGLLGLPRAEAARGRVSNQAEWRLLAINAVV